jgi:hypothetical protein
MFNPIAPSEIVTAIGRTALEAAGSEGELSGFDRVQLKSAYSATRHLGVELESFPPELIAFCARVGAAIERAGAELEPDERSWLDDLAARLVVAAGAGAAGTPVVAEQVCEILERARGHQHGPWPALRGEMHSALRDLCDREVELLTAVVEARRS